MEYISVTDLEEWLQNKKANNNNTNKLASMLIDWLVWIGQ